LNYRCWDLSSSTSPFFTLSPPEYWQGYLTANFGGDLYFGSGYILPLAVTVSVMVCKPLFGSYFNIVFVFVFSDDH